jgi:hypothetical protein
MKTGKMRSSFRLPSSWLPECYSALISMNSLSVAIVAEETPTVRQNPSSGKCDILSIMENPSTWGFKNPHQGEFVFLIPWKYRGYFADDPQNLYRLSDEITITGKIVWYQGDPVIYVTDPSQIEVISK